MYNYFLTRFLENKWKHLKIIKKYSLKILCFIFLRIESCFIFYQETNQNKSFQTPFSLYDFILFLCSISLPYAQSLSGLLLPWTDDPFGFLKWRLLCVSIIGPAQPSNYWFGPERKSRLFSIGPWTIVVQTKLEKPWTWALRPN